MIISISAKCSDLFSMQSMDTEPYSGYVPTWFPEDHYGDYVMLDIDTKTGRILNWPKGLKDSTVQKTFSEESR